MRNKKRTIEEKQIEVQKLYEIKNELKTNQKELKSQRCECFNASLEEMIFNNNKQLKEISERIHVLQIAIQSQIKTRDNPKIRTDSAVYKTYGKKVKDLTKEELKVYQSRKERKKRAQEREERG